MNLDAQKPVEVRRIGANLIASFHRANPPLVWRFDLDRNHSFSLALQGEDGDWELGLTSPKGDFQPVARFVQREDAEEAFIRVEKVLAQNQRPWSKYLLRVLGIIALLLVIIATALAIGGGLKALNTMSDVSHVPEELGSMMAPTGMPAPVPEMKSGVPEPADQFLRPPE